MALSKEIWKKAKFLFEIGKSLNEISLETDINRTSISKKAKAENWTKKKNLQLKSDIVEYENEKSTLDDKKSTLIQQLSTLDDFEITLMNTEVEQETKIASLITSSAQLAIIRTNQLLTSNKTYEKINVGDGMQQFDLRELNANDIKTCVEAIDKASITLGVNDRHASSQVQVNTQHNNSNPEKKWTVEVVKP